MTDSGTAVHRQHDPAERARILAQIDETELVIEKLVTGGDGLGRLSGIPILVELAAPGDRLRVRLTERRPDYARAEILEILEPGPSRRTPPCAFYGRCGGCDLQHIEEDAQLRFKVESSLETLKRLGGVEIESPVVHAGDRWGYRLRAQFQVDTSDPASPRVGYHVRRSHDVVPVDRCAILHPEIEAFLSTLERRLPAQPPRRIDVAVASDGSLGVAPIVEGMPHGELELAVDGVKIRFDARCFVQGHGGLLDTLVREAIDSVSTDGGEGGSDSEAGTAYDLYSGVGLFAVFLARRYPRVVSVEGDRVAVRYARRNLRTVGGDSEVIHQRVERWINRLPEGAARVLVDPPRSGLPTAVRRALYERPPRRLTYVSCQPATLARDLAALRDRYRIERVAFLDLFPQTSHVETVVQLVGAEDVS